MKNSNTTKFKTIHVWSSNDERFVWEGTAGDLVDDFLSDAERAEKEFHDGNVEYFAWAIAAIADMWEDGAEYNLKKALNRDDIALEIY